ncbi:uncharacterized protein LOC131686873 [Topomyia yanbarensis]|uniref:uncharacterized protein LOC131686873 n=1 Tax=Topomyia yanbarensis TaxID=2498891 RepID=UPI00273A9980|nr:uncharacterized protein LOC131686873 [Topomyia yanbarensis]
MVVSVAQLNNILSNCGFDEVSSDLATIIVRQINIAINDRNEAAMFIAHLIQQSGGFKYRDRPGKGHPDAPYSSRGYIQLTWKYNYEAASSEIYGDDRLVQNPELLSSDPETSMNVSVWFWIKRVRPTAAPFTNFYLTTKAINGTEEDSFSNPTAKKRYAFYLKAASVLGIFAKEG